MTLFRLSSLGLLTVRFTLEQPTKGCSGLAFLSAKKLWNPFKELSFSNAQQDVSRLASAKVLPFHVMAKLFLEKFSANLSENAACPWLPACGTDVCALQKFSPDSGESLRNIATDCKNHTIHPFHQILRALFTPFLL